MTNEEIKNFILSQTEVKIPFLQKQLEVSYSQANKAVNELVEQGLLVYVSDITFRVNKVQRSAEPRMKPQNADELMYVRAMWDAINYRYVSVTSVQRKCRCGFNKAGHIVRWMEDNRFIDEETGKVILTAAEFRKLFGNPEELFADEDYKAKQQSTVRPPLDFFSVTADGTKAKSSYVEPKDEEKDEEKEIDEGIKKVAKKLASFGTDDEDDEDDEDDDLYYNEDEDFDEDDDEDDIECLTSDEEKRAKFMEYLRECTRRDEEEKARCKDAIIISNGINQGLKVDKDNRKIMVCTANPEVKTVYGYSICEDFIRLSDCGTTLKDYICTVAQAKKVLEKFSAKVEADEIVVYFEESDEVFEAMCELYAAIKAINTAYKKK